MDKAGGVCQFSQFCLNEGIGYVPTVPTQKYIHFMNRGEGNVRGVPFGGASQFLEGSKLGGT
jgi:hypothetical protein